MLLPGAILAALTFSRKRGNRMLNYAKTLLLAVLLPVFCFTGVVPAVPGQVLADGGVIRFHVRASSNDPHDQEIKNYLAGSMLQVFGPTWSGCQNSRQLQGLIERDKEWIRKTAVGILEGKGVFDPVTVEFARHPFPARFYGEHFFPPGEYASLIIEIGPGEGENWWCVLFPPLCFTVFPVPNFESSVQKDGGGASPPDAPARLKLSSGYRDPMDGILTSTEEKGCSPSRGKTTKWRFWSIDLLTKIFRGREQ
jgi:stage II sporulation protein R